jgi:single-strand DNA-binding protein
MAAMNRVYLLGQIEGKPEIKSLENGDTVAYFSLITTEKNKIDYHRLIAWNRAADYVRSLRTGDEVFVEGKLQSRKLGGDILPEIVAWTIVPVKQRVGDNIGNELTD